jgi:hypothetical protein
MKALRPPSVNRPVVTALPSLGERLRALAGTFMRGRRASGPEAVAAQADQRQPQRGAAGGWRTFAAWVGGRYSEEESPGVLSELWDFALEGPISTPRWHLTRRVQARSGARTLILELHTARSGVDRLHRTRMRVGVYGVPELHFDVERRGAIHARGPHAERMRTILAADDVQLLMRQCMVWKWFGFKAMSWMQSRRVRAVPESADGQAYAIYFEEDTHVQDDGRLRQIHMLLSRVITEMESAALIGPGDPGDVW